MKTSTPVWKPLLLAFVLLMLFVSTGALLAAVTVEGPMYYVFGGLNFLMYAAGLYFLYRFLFANPRSLELDDAETETLYTALQRYHQVRKLPNKTFNTEVSCEGIVVKVSADKEKGEVSIKMHS